MRLRFRPATLVHPKSHKALTNTAKPLLIEEEDDERYQALCRLPAQGEIARSWGDTLPEVWVRAIQDLPPKPLKFALNAFLEALPTNTNLYLWGK